MISNQIAPKSTGAFFWVGFNPKNAGGHPQEREKKKRKNTECNYNVFKSEYSIQSLLLVVLSFWVVVMTWVWSSWWWLSNDFRGCSLFWDDALGSDLFLLLIRFDLLLLHLSQGQLMGLWEFLWLVPLEPSHWCTCLSGCTGLGERLINRVVVHFH